MKVLMFGWEFPPYNSGGLGTACYGLTKGLSKNDIHVKFVIPKSYPNMEADYVELISPYIVEGEMKNLQKIAVNSLLKGYSTSESYSKEYEKYSAKVKRSRDSKGIVYGNDLFEEVIRFGHNAGEIAKHEEHDIIHCHDWLTYEAGIHAKSVSGKPLVVHIHATEFDRTANNPNQHIYNIEKKGFEFADKILAVSQFTKNRVIENYGIDSDKIEVVHNAVEFNDNKFDFKDSALKKTDKIVLFLGRITIQKGPDWFLYAAQKALQADPNIKFIVAGSGDMEHFMIEKAAEMGIGDKVLFTGFLRGKDIDQAYQTADLYVMPSISEPFGITPLEAMRNNTPVLISKQSGVSEVVSHCLKCDFWNINDMASKIVSAVNLSPLHKELKENGAREIKKFDWKIPAKKCIDAYRKVLKNRKIGVSS